MPAFLLGDVLRSIHFGLPTAIKALDYLAPVTSTNRAALTIYKAIVVEGRPAPADLAKDGSLLSLVIILADIHTLHCVFHQLCEPASSSGVRDPRSFDNLYVPLSAANETHLVRRKIRLALDMWAASYLLAAPRPVAALFYFAKMYLAVPNLQILPVQANYPPRSSQDDWASREGQQSWDEDIGNTAEAAKLAWQILEHADGGSEMTPSWLPISVFFASLVVWRAVRLGGDSAIHGSLRVLLLFKQELEKMCWPCCDAMAATLDSLIA